ncbi:MAG: methionyl-tRNA formyltransferase, partial [Aquificae bacterium]|nr:methionyl-tRNA formyltransferase [Aquificota bacterium]
PPVKVFALERKIPVYQPRTKEELIKTVKDLKPDCIVVVAYGKILPKEVLEVPRLGALNLHASLLPKYRGAAPIQRALMAGEKETGNTVILINERLDAGPILSQERIRIEEEDNLLTLSEKLSKSGAKLLGDTLARWLGGSVRPKPQREEEATYAPPVAREEFRLCWKAPAESVRDRVRGLYPDVYAFFRGKRVKLLRVRPFDAEGAPGEVLDEKRLIVACGEGAVEILELISPKGRRMSGEEFVRGYKPRREEFFS